MATLRACPGGRGRYLIKVGWSGRAVEDSLTIYIAMGAAVSVVSLPFVAVALHQRRKKKAERALAFRKKEKIQL